MSEEKKKAKSKVWLIVVGALIVIGVIANNDKKNTDTSSSDRIKNTEQKPVATINAVKLHQEYEANQVLADDRYKNKMIIVTGKVNGIKKNPITDDMYIALDSGTYGMLDVDCYFDEDQKKVMMDLQVGTWIKIRGVCKGKMLSISLKECSLEK